MEEKLTNVEKRRNELAFSKIEIMRILKWTELEYCEYQFEMGLKYLHHYVGDENHQLNKSAHFWGWWKNMWGYRDENLLIKGFERLTFDEARRMYYNVNDAFFLSQNIYPDRTMMDESYTKMIHEFTEKELSKKSTGDSGIEPELSPS